MTKQYSPEILELRARVIRGNKVLLDAWVQICELEHGSQQWKDELERWHQANEKLAILCSNLQGLGYRDCLFINDKGEKSLGCLTQGGIGCRVCPSEHPYWEKELMDLPSPARSKAEESVQQEFVEKLGGIQ